MSEHEKLRKGIAAYADQQATLLDVIRQHGGTLTQDEFDDEFANFSHIEEIRDGKRWRIPVMGGKHPWQAYLVGEDTIILGSMTQGQWGKWLDLLQITVSLGDVKRTIEGGKVTYHLDRLATTGYNPLMQQDPIQKMAQLCDANFKKMAEWMQESNGILFAQIMGLLATLIEKGLLTEAEWKANMDAAKACVDSAVAKAKWKEDQEKLSDLMERLTRPSKQ